MSAPALPAISRTGSPYKGLDHYGEQDAPFFFGREVECDLVVANLLAARLTLLYGQSGVGKSSLLHAGVLPRLRETPDLAVVIFRSWSSDPVAGLSAAIWAAAGLERPAGQSSLADTIAGCTQRLGRDLVVILDQFEEYFVYHPREDGDGTFVGEFPRAVNQRDLPVSFLVSMREDALAWLDRFKGRIPNLFGNYLRIDRLSRKAGRDAIVRPLEEYERRVAESERVEIEPQLIEAVLTQVRAGNVELGQTGAGVIDGASDRDSRIEAPFLQLVLTRLWEEESAAGSRMLRLETLDRLGGAERIVPAHLDAAMAHLPRPERDLAARVLRFLVTPSGTKIALRASDLAAYAKVSADKVGLLLDRLSGQQARILRGTDDGRYEIYHDVLAAAILDWRARHLQAIRGAKRRRRISLAFLLLILFIGGIIVLNVAAPNSALSTLGGTDIGLITTGAIIIPIFSLGVWWGRKHP
jgi:Novel STAND NTPase 1